MKNAFLLASLGAVSMLVLSVTAEAQTGRRPRVPHYQRSQTISPYVQLFGRNNGGGVTNYFLEVRPRLQLQQDLNRIQQDGFRQQQQQQQMYMQQSQELNQMLGNPNGPLIQFSNRGGRGGRISTAGSFMNTGAFFPTSGTNASGARAARFGR